MGRPSEAERYAEMHAIWRHDPASGNGVVYVGSMKASQDTELLKEHGITHIVNCMQRTRLNKHRETLGIEYFDFDVEEWIKSIQIKTTEQSSASPTCLLDVQGWIDQVNKGDQGPGSKAHVSAGPKQETQWPCIHEDEVEWARERLSAKSTPTRDDGKPASTR